jgi:hypothetical protein
MKLAKFALILYIISSILLLYSIVSDNKNIDLVISGMLVPIIFLLFRI